MATKNVKTNILIKPMITEKSERISDSLGKYSFIVNKKANKIEIRKAVEDMYNVNVVAVNTVIMPAKERSRFTRTGVMKGFVSSYKKAIITLEEGESIDIFGEI